MPSSHSRGQLLAVWYVGTSSFRKADLPRAGRMMSRAQQFANRRRRVSSRPRRSRGRPFQPRQLPVFLVQVSCQPARFLDIRRKMSSYLSGPLLPHLACHPIIPSIPSKSAANLKFCNLFWRFSVPGEKLVLSRIIVTPIWKVSCQLDNYSAKRWKRGPGQGQA